MSVITKQNAPSEWHKTHSNGLVYHVGQS